MVRIYCLSSIQKIPPNAIEIIPYEEGSPELTSFNNDMDTWDNIKDSENCFVNYELTEIVIGYDYSFDERKRYLISIYRKDTGALVFKMMRGIVTSLNTTENICEFSISTSLIYPGYDDPDFDLQIRIRCVRYIDATAEIIKGLLTEQEETYYEEYAQKIKNFCTLQDGEIHSFATREAAFDSIEFKLPNVKKVLKQKLTDFTNAIDLLCDPKTGRYRNVPVDERFNQKMKCFLIDGLTWVIKLHRVSEVNKQIKNYFHSKHLKWQKVALEKLTFKPEKLDNLQTIRFGAMHIYQSPTEFYSFWKKLNFEKLTKLQLLGCYLKKLSDEFFELLPESLTNLCLEENEITFVSEKILRLKHLKVLTLEKNYELEDFPWKCISAELEALNMVKTNILEISSEMPYLKHLKCLEISSPQLKFIPWEKFGNNVEEMSVEAGKKLTEFKLPGSYKMSEFRLCNSGVMEIDSDSIVNAFEKLSILELKPGPILHTLILRNNNLHSLKWNLLPETLQWIDVSKNKLKSIDDISHMKNLNVIQAESNLISHISDTTCQIPLLNLFLGRNELKELPQSFQTFIKLVDLDISWNHFDYKKTDLKIVLWNRLPPNLTMLKLSGNKLYILPCSLNKKRIERLNVFDCNLQHICFHLFGDENVSVSADWIRIFEIGNNPNLEYLPFIPSEIYQPPNNKNVCTDEDDPENLRIFTNNAKLLHTKRHAYKNFYKFEEDKGKEFDCKCCAKCGNPTDRKVFKQLMVMDCGLRLWTKINISKYYPAGNWKTEIRTRMCQVCFDNLLKKIQNFQKSKSTKKQKKTINKPDSVDWSDKETGDDQGDNLSENEGAEETKNLNDLDLTNFDDITYNVPDYSPPIPEEINYSYLLLKNLTGADCFLNSALNIIDSMKALRYIISEKAKSLDVEATPTHQEMARIFERKIDNVLDLRKTLPIYEKNEQEDAATALYNLINLLDDFSKQLVQYILNTIETCGCGRREAYTDVPCSTLHLTIGKDNLEEVTLDSMIAQWTTFYSRSCSKCNNAVLIEHDVKNGVWQNYFIIEINALINRQDADGFYTCPIITKKFNFNAHLIFGQYWKLICAVEYLGNVIEGHYKTWRRNEDKWIVISDNNYCEKTELLQDFSKYRILVFELTTAIPNNDNKNIEESLEIEGEQPCDEIFSDSTFINMPYENQQPLSLHSYLLLENANTTDFNFNVIVNVIDSMKEFRDSISENAIYLSVETTQHQLAKIMERKNDNFFDLQQSLRLFTTDGALEDAVKILDRIITLLDDFSIAFIKFVYNTTESCQCGKIFVHNNIACSTLYLTIDISNLTEVTFNSMITQWQNSYLLPCSQCGYAKIRERNVKLGEDQKYLIIELNKSIVLNDSFETSSSIIYHIFDELWELICAVQYNGNNEPEHYLIWRKNKDKWIVISNDDCWEKDVISQNFSNYRILVFEKIN